jgi:hypothetical protein
MNNSYGQIRCGMKKITKNGQKIKSILWMHLNIMYLVNILYINICFYLLIEKYSQNNMYENNKYSQTE